MMALRPLDGLSRRDFLARGASCAAHLALLSAGAPLLARRAFAAEPAGRVVAQEPWGRLEQIADGVWALISTPLQDRTTLCNGGIVRGRAGIVVVESFARNEGAAWLAHRARELTGRWPDDVVLTHYHGDHTGGVAGFARDEGTPRIRATSATRDRVREQDARREEPPAQPRPALLASTTLLDPTTPTLLDLGDRTVRIIPREGHTASDVTIELDEPSVVFCGDLVWNKMFPNYVDATPSRLARDVRALVRERPAAYVPGHGPMADGADVRRYLAVLDDVEAAARRALERGTPVADAAREYQLPESLGEWLLFSPRYFEVAFGAWARELTQR